MTKKPVEEVVGERVEETIISTLMERGYVRVNRYMKGDGHLEWRDPLGNVYPLARSLTGDQTTGIILFIPGVWKGGKDQSNPNTS